VKPKNAKRPNWDEYFIEITKVICTRSTCLRRKVGAIIVKDKRILASGYNGAPSGLKHCGEIGGCLRAQMKVPSGQRHELCRGLHAEQNAIIQAAVHGVSIKDSVLYCTTHPCIICAKMIINAGIKKVVISAAYPDKESKKLLKEAGIQVKILKK
jgi:dCMP deaminase